MKRYHLKRILHKISMKFKQIHENFAEIQVYLNKRYGTAFPKQQKRTLYIKEIPDVDPDAPDYDAARVAAIENNTIQINDYLLTQTSTMVNTL